jgi:hypothetical protein
VFLSKCYFYCTLSRQAEFPNYPKYCLSEIGSAPFISDNRGSTVYIYIYIYIYGCVCVGGTCVLVVVLLMVYIHIKPTENRCGNLNILYQFMIDSCEHKKESE